MLLWDIVLTETMGDGGKMLYLRLEKMPEIKGLGPWMGVVEGEMLVNSDYPEDAKVRNMRIDSFKDLLHHSWISILHCRFTPVSICAERAKRRFFVRRRVDKDSVIYLPAQPNDHDDLWQTQLTIT